MRVHEVKDKTIRSPARPSIRCEGDGLPSSRAMKRSPLTLALSPEGGERTISLSTLALETVS
jgi:hypothetical protein